MAWLDDRRECPLRVRPRAGGGGIATRLLAALLDPLSSGGLVEAELWVYCDNTRAIDLYRRAQWRPSKDVRIQPSSSRREQRYTLAIATEPSQKDRSEP